MLNKDRRQRLGQDGDLDQILTHPFFADLDMSLLLQKKVKAPYLPTVTHPRDLRNFDAQVTGEALAESILPASHIEEINKHEKRGTFDLFGPTIGSSEASPALNP